MNLPDISKRDLVGIVPVLSVATFIGIWAAFSINKADIELEQKSTNIRADWSEIDGERIGYDLKSTLRFGDSVSTIIYEKLGGSSVISAVEINCGTKTQKVQHMSFVNSNTVPARTDIGNKMPTTQMDSLGNGRLVTVTNTKVHEAICVRDKPKA